MANNTPDINEVPLEVVQEAEAFGLPTEVLVKELRSRGFNVVDGTEYDEATGLLKWTASDAEYYFDTETHKLVPNEEAYKRATNGW